jgi:hypothetical protein
MKGEREKERKREREKERKRETIRTIDGISSLITEVIRLCRV